MRKISGEMSWGDGTNAQDVRLYRAAASVLQINQGGSGAAAGLQVGHFGVAPSLPSADANAAVNTGWYCTIPSCVNLPVGDYGALMVANVTYTGACRQIWWQHGTYATWTRYLNSGTWSAWVQVWPLGGADANWTGLTPASGWTAPGGAYPTLKYRKLSNGMVNVQAFLYWVGGGTQPSGATTIATLPAGYRPSAIIITQNVAAGNAYGTSCRVDVAPSGVMSYIQGDNVNNFLAMNLSFFAEQ